ncbi:MAG TPA: cytochrome c, partial [Hyphomicrobiaceae bacterium]|nr:cytochrome c [Hyphomicrobiaceae bacterium]
MMKSKALLAVAVIAGAAIGASALVNAQDVIAQRKALMKATGGAFKTATDMAKGEAPFDAAKASAAMKKIADDWPVFMKLFPDNSKTGGETTAHGDIWTKRAEF